MAKKKNLCSSHSMGDKCWFCDKPPHGKPCKSCGITLHSFTCKGLENAWEIAAWYHMRAAERVQYAREHNEAGADTLSEVFQPLRLAFNRFDKAIYDNGTCAAQVAFQDVERAWTDMSAVEDGLRIKVGA